MTSRVSKASSSTASHIPTPNAAAPPICSHEQVEWKWITLNRIRPVQGTLLVKLLSHSFMKQLVGDWRNKNLEIRKVSAPSRSTLYLKFLLIIISRMFTQNRRLKVIRINFRHFPPQSNPMTSEQSLYCNENRIWTEYWPLHEVLSFARGSYSSTNCFRNRVRTRIKLYG